MENEALQPTQPGSPEAYLKFEKFLDSQSPAAMYCALLMATPSKVLNAVDFLITRDASIDELLAPGQPLAVMIPDDPECLPHIRRVLTWRKYGLENHFFCVCHSERN